MSGEVLLTRYLVYLMYVVFLRCPVDEILVIIAILLFRMQKRSFKNNFPGALNSSCLALKTKSQTRDMKSRQHLQSASQCDQKKCVFYKKAADIGETPNLAKPLQNFSLRKGVAGIVNSPSVGAMPIRLESSCKGVFINSNCHKVGSAFFSEPAVTVEGNSSKGNKKNGVETMHGKDSSEKMQHEEEKSSVIKKSDNSFQFNFSEVSGDN